MIKSSTSPNRNNNSSAGGGRSKYFLWICFLSIIVIYQFKVPNKLVKEDLDYDETGGQLHQKTTTNTNSTVTNVTDVKTTTKSPVPTSTPTTGIIEEKKLSSTSCSYHLWAFNRNGKVTSGTKDCITSDIELLNLLEELANPNIIDIISNTNNEEKENDDLTVSIAIGSSLPNHTSKKNKNLRSMTGTTTAIHDDDDDGMTMLNNLADIIDEFRAPRLEWRIMAERFQNFNANEIIRGDELFYDPAIFVNVRETLSPLSFSDNFATPAALARQKLLIDLGGDNGNKVTTREEEEEILAIHRIDFILVRVLEEKLASIARALRLYQYPENCDELEQKTKGRIFMPYANGKDFLGALTNGNVGKMTSAFAAGAPFVNAAPPVWARTYHFENCTKANGYECGFLPIYGGECILPQVMPALECLSHFTMGWNKNIVLPKNGIPQHICDDGMNQSPALSPDAPFDGAHYNYGADSPDVFKEWCATCNNFGVEPQKPSPETVSSSDIPLGVQDIKLIGGTIRDYIAGENEDKSDPCTLKATPLECGARNSTCCANEVEVPQNVLGSTSKEDRPNVGFLGSVLSSFMTRFNRKSRYRIANLHQPRTKAMDKRNEGWEAALATGNCATLHIRRGDNIDRCANGNTQFCSMNLTLSDYMKKATPMLEQLDDAKHVFVMTDDPEVVADDKLEPWQEKGYYLEVVSGYNQYSQQTYDDWDPFIESVHTGKACRALVGHYISTVSKLLFESICARYSECPIHDMMKHVDDDD